MATQHLCLEHPEREADGEKWRDGSVDSCSYHGQRVINQPKVRMSGRDRARADKAAGTVGQDRGGYING